MSKDGIVALIIFKNRPFDTKAHDRQNSFIRSRQGAIGRSNVLRPSLQRGSMFISFFFDQIGRSRPASAHIWSSCSPLMRPSWHLLWNKILTANHA